VGPIYENMMSSTKPGVHKMVTPPAEDRTAATVNMHRELGKVSKYGSCDMYANRHTDILRPKDRYTHPNIPFPSTGEQLSK